MTGRVGVLVAGVKGAVATTLIAGLHAARRGLARPVGLMSETDAVEGLDVPGLDDLEFGGWDLARGNVAEAAGRHGIVPRHVLDGVEADLRQVEVFRAPTVNVSPAVARLVGASEGDAEETRARAAVDKLRDEMRVFAQMNDCDRVVVVNAMSTTPEPARAAEAWPDLAAFERALDAGDPRITPALMYAYAAFKEGASFVNFTPNAAAETPALAELADARRVPYAGKDGKTGQTLYKTSLAELFRIRDLRVKGWYSTNILGNQDGAVLAADAAHAAPKIESKRRVLESILGYGDFEHVVRIDHYGPRGDEKEAWDVVDFEGWLGRRMTLRVNWQGEDSTLAAPVLLDAVRLTAFAHARGEKGPLTHLALFFKDPHGTHVHALAAQHRQLLAYLDACRRDARALTPRPPPGPRPAEEEAAPRA